MITENDIINGGAQKLPFLRWKELQHVDLSPRLIKFFKESEVSLPEHFALYFWSIISEQAKLTPDVLRDSSIPWVWENVSQNQCITPELLEETKELDWDLCKLSINDSFTLKMLDIEFTNPKTSWDTYALSDRVPFEFFKRHVGLKWNYNVLLRRRDIMFDILLYPALARTVIIDLLDLL